MITFIKNKPFLFLSLLFFLISLTLPTYTTDHFEPEYGSGFADLLFGPLALLMGGAGIAWLGNPLIAFSWIFSKRKPKTALILAILGLCFALSFLLFKQMIVDEAGHYGPITNYYLGYWLWLVSYMCMILHFFIPKNKFANPQV